MSVLSRVEFRSRRTPKVEMYNPPTAPHFKLSTSILASAVELRSMRMPLFGSVRFWSPGPIFVRADPMFKAQKPKFRPPYTKGSWFWSISFPALDLIHARTCLSARQLNYGFKTRPSYNCAGPTDARVFGVLGCTIVRVGPIIHSCVLNLRSAQRDRHPPNRTKRVYSTTRRASHRSAFAPCPRETRGRMWRFLCAR